MKNICVNLFLCAVMFCGYSQMLPVASGQQEDMLEGFEEEQVAVSGELIKIKMTESPDNPWEELALQSEDGKIYLLIGRKAESLLSLIGRKVAVKGVTKPSMTVKGRACAVIQVSGFDLQDKDTE